MAISEREVKNKRNSAGELTGKPGIVYDVNIKYKSGGQHKAYTKKGFTTKAEAKQHEAEMRAKLTNASYTPPTAAQRKMTVSEYMTEWIERHGSANLRPSTKASYQSSIRVHIIPHLGDVPISQLTPAMLDDLYAELSDAGLSSTSVKYVHRIMGVAMEHARKYHYIESNPARDTLTKFGKQGETPAPYTVDQMRGLLAVVSGTELELPVVLAGLYGLRVSECIGLRWRNVDLDAKTLAVVEQFPYDTPADIKHITEMAPVKSSGRVLPITDMTLPYFQKQKERQAEQKRLLLKADQPYYDNDLVVAKPNGLPIRRDQVSTGFRAMLQQYELPHMRFHDLRHSAATNMHELTGDFFTVGQILGHSLKGIGIQLGISSNLESVTAQYINVRLDRKKAVLNVYHQAVLGDG